MRGVSRTHVAFGLLIVALGGCLSDDGPSAGIASTPLDPMLIPRVDVEHDHMDVALHAQIAEGFTVVSSVRIDEGAFPLRGIAGLDLGNAGRMKLAGDLLFVASDRETRSGFVIVDVSDPAHPEPLGAYRSDAGAYEGEALAVTPDAQFAFVTIETAFSPQPVTPFIEIVDVSDPAAPALAARVPTADQPHVVTYAEIDGSAYLFVSSYQLTLAAPGLPVPGVNEPASTVDTALNIFRFDPSVPALVPAGSVRLDPTQIEEGGFFVHDTTVLEHPATGATLLYFGAFGGGGRIFDLADPTSPTQVGYTLDKGAAPVLRHHSFEPGPELMDGILPTAAIPRSLGSDGPGGAHLSLYDTADPTAPDLLGQWRHPDVDFLPGDQPPLNLHIPSYAAGGTRLLVPHFHAGLFAFDVSTRAAMEDPRPIAYFQPGTAPDDGARGAGIVSAAIEVDGHVLVMDSAAGTLYSLTLDA